ncbi:MAG: tellurite methyltransferase [Solirubrobacteraceae bacterium]|nr:tellurite methyltransferase [Solirubrobacteraceae bacterium]
MDVPTAREKWNRRYAEPGFAPVPATPGEWLVENRDLLAGGRALDVACGDGRNSRYLAQLGFTVDAIDISDVAVDALRSAARARGLAVAARVLDLETTTAAAAAGGGSLGAGEYDVVVNLNFLSRGLFPALARALRPGGLLVFETFTETHARELGHRFDARFLLGPNELLRAFPELLVRRYREETAVRSGQPRGVAGLVAQRPTAG